MKNNDCVVGVDEVGRGPLAGPVVASAVVLDPEQPIEGLADSKQLTAKRRDYLFQVIQEKAKAYAIAQVEVDVIDKINILQASLLAMQQAVMKLNLEPSLVLVDGQHCPQLPYAMDAVIQGDKHHACISAASILAKVTRDNYMVKLDEMFPGYGFAQHKGYPTAAHRQALQRLGPSIHHRLSFKPVASLLDA